MEPTKVVGRRVAAYLIDNILISLVGIALFFAMAKSQDEIVDDLREGDLDLTDTTYGNVQVGDTEYAIVGGTFWLFLLIMLVIGILYFWVLPGLKGWTPGKAALGLRIVRDDFSCPAGVGKNAIRSLLWVVDAFPYVFGLYLVGFITALTNNRNKRVGDMVAGTLVVKKEYANQPAAAAAAGAPAFAAAGAPGFAPPAAAQPAAPVAAGTPAGWHPDPRGEKRLRYWDGQSWTDHTAD